MVYHTECIDTSSQNALLIITLQDARYVIKTVYEESYLLPR